MEDPDAWARHVLHNLAVSQWRRQELRLAHRTFSRAPSSPPPDMGHLDVARAISRLPANPRRALVLKTVLGMCTAEIATELGASEGTGVQPGVTQTTDFHVKVVFKAASTAQSNHPIFSGWFDYVVRATGKAKPGTGTSRAYRCAYQTTAKALALCEV